MVVGCNIPPLDVYHHREAWGMMSLLLFVPRTAIIPDVRSWVLVGIGLSLILLWRVNHE